MYVVQICVIVPVFVETKLFALEVHTNARDIYMYLSDGFGESIVRSFLKNKLFGKREVGIFETITCYLGFI